MLATFKDPSAPTGPTKAALAAYRKLVQSNADPDDQVLHDAWKIATEFHTDRAVWLAAKKPTMR